MCGEATERAEERRSVWRSKCASNKISLIQCALNSLQIEKNVTPSAAALAKEKGEFEVFQGVASFDRSSLKHASTVEKDVRPDADVIAKERKESDVIKGAMRLRLIVIRL